MAYKSYSGGQQPIKTGEQITMEEFHKDFVLLNNLIVLKDHEMLHAYAELMRNKWVILIADTKYADEMKKLDERVEYNKNRFALSKGIINILRRAGWDAGFYGNVKIAGKNPYEIKRT